MCSSDLPAPPKALLADCRTHSGLAVKRVLTPGYQMPGYAGATTGHQHVAGMTFSAICAGEAGPPSGARIGEGAPGLSANAFVHMRRNLQPGVVYTSDAGTRKCGYTGHVPGQHESTTFGKPFYATTKALLAEGGRPVAGGVDDPGRPFIKDVEAKLAYPEGHIGRPSRLSLHVAGYAGFRPRSMPGSYR